jgi:hypothetical protein
MKTSLTCDTSYVWLCTTREALTYYYWRRHLYLDGVASPQPLHEVLSQHGHHVGDGHGHAQNEQLDKGGERSIRRIPAIQQLNGFISRKDTRMKNDSDTD